MSMSELITSLEADLNLPSPLTQLHSPLLSNKQLSVYIKRDDQIDPYISGNKYRKLKGHLAYYSEHQDKYQGIITFGGAYSNHLYATSAACFRQGIPLTAIVRGEEVDLENNTLSLLVRHGHTIHRIARSDYRLKAEAPQVKALLLQHSYYLIPEGGNSPLSNVGVADIYTEIRHQVQPDYIALASGTGATASGLLRSMQSSNTQLIVAAGARDESVRARLVHEDVNKQVRWFDEEWGGFGKKKAPLLEAMEAWTAEYNVPLEYVYTGKLICRLWSLIKADYFDRGSTLVIIHTGGLRPESH